MRARVLPLALLLAYGVAFAAAALGVSLLVYDDHPGQLYRLWHVVTRGPAPWAWSPDWWAGYPEMQFYPPGFAYLGALLYRTSLGVLGVAGAYQAMLWLTYLAPGATAWLALMRVTGSGWAALPGAFVALSLSGSPSTGILASGVEGGVHIGMVAARLAGGLLPLLLFVLAGWTGLPPIAVAPLVAAVVLTHPAYLPSAVAAVALAAIGVPGERRRRLIAAAWLLTLAAALSAFWTLPLVVRLADARALAWGSLELEAFAHLLPVAMILLSIVGLCRLRDGPASADVLFAGLPWATAIVVVLDALVLEPLGVRWLPANRIMDSVWLAAVLSAGALTGRWIEAASRGQLWRGAAGAGVALATAVVLSLPGGTLMLWPRTADWPAWEPTVRGLRLTALWDAVRAVPPGRVLFLRSGVPLAYSREWSRPHTHITALTPVLAGRAIVSGTFTHPSPIAAFFYRGAHGGRAPLRELAEQLDGVSVFGQRLETLDPVALDALADRLGVSAVVALDEDVPRLRALADNNVRFTRRVTSPPFVVFVRSGPAPGAVPLRDGAWRLLASGRADWEPAGIAYYPLWHATTAGSPVRVRRGVMGDLEVHAPAPGAQIDLTYEPGTPEFAGIAISALAVATMVALMVARWRQRGGVAQGTTVLK